MHNVPHTEIYVQADEIVRLTKIEYNCTYTVHEDNYSSELHVHVHYSINSANNGGPPTLAKHNAILKSHD